MRNLAAATAVLRRSKLRTVLLPKPVNVYASFRKSVAMLPFRISDFGFRIWQSGRRIARRAARNPQSAIHNTSSKHLSCLSLLAFVMVLTSSLCAGEKKEKHSLPRLIFTQIPAGTDFGLRTGDTTLRAPQSASLNPQPISKLANPQSAIRNPQLQSALPDPRLMPVAANPQSAIRNPQSPIAIGTPRSTTNAGGRESAIRNPQSAIAAGAPFLPPLRNIPGSRVVSLDFSKGGKTLNVLTPEFASACSPVVSFDGKRVVFVGKKGADDPWNVWEMSISGDEKRRILETPWDCVTPTYLPSIYTLDNLNPRDQVVFAGAASGEVNEYGTGPAWSFIPAN